MLVKLHSSRGNLHLLIEEGRRNDSESYSAKADVAFGVLESNEFVRLKGKRKSYPHI